MNNKPAYELLEQDGEMFKKTGIFHYKRIDMGNNLWKLELERRETNGKPWRGIFKLVGVDPETGEETEYIPGTNSKSNK
jgi:hypothetical protein